MSTQLATAPTRARNYQNDVKAIAFAALDEEQERVRRELQHVNIEYVYRVGEPIAGYDSKRILVTEALQALAMLSVDPRYPVWMKRSLVDFQKIDGDPYKDTFSEFLSSIRLVNAVRVHRYIRGQVAASIQGSSLEEKRAYTHGEYAMTFVFAKQFRDAIDGVALIDTDKLAHAGSAPFDQLRQAHLEIIQSIPWPGPLSISKNEHRTLDVIRSLMVLRYGLVDDPAIGPLRAKVVIGQPYQVDLFKYLARRAPQIGGLT